MNMSMAAYILRRLLLMIPTLLGIMLISFVIIQFVPGGPVERMIAQLQGHGTDATARFSGSGGADMAMNAVQNVGEGSFAHCLLPIFKGLLVIRFSLKEVVEERTIPRITGEARVDGVVVRSKLN